MHRFNASVSVMMLGAKGILLLTDVTNCYIVI